MLRRAFSSNDETAQRSWDLADVSTDVCAGRVLCQCCKVSTHGKQLSTGDCAVPHLPTMTSGRWLTQLDLCALTLDDSESCKQLAKFLPTFAEADPRHLAQAGPMTSCFAAPVFLDCIPTSTSGSTPGPRCLMAALHSGIALIF